MPVDQIKSLCQLCERIRQPSELGKHTTSSTTTNNDNRATNNVHKSAKEELRLDRKIRSEAIANNWTPEILKRSQQHQWNTYHTEKIVCKVRFIFLRTGSLCLNYMPICKCFAPKPQNTINNLKIDWKGELTYQRKMKFWRKWSSFCMLSNRSPLRLRSVKRATLFTRLIVSIFFL